MADDITTLRRILKTCHTVAVVGLSVKWHCPRTAWTRSTNVSFPGGESASKTAWRDGTTHLVMSPLEVMQRLAALVPRPRLHLIRFGVRVTSLREVSGPPLRDHGVLAPNAKLRALVVPQVVPQEPEAPEQEAKPADCEANCAHHRPVRLSWAKLLKRVFDLDLEHCPNCGGELKIIAAILEQPVIEKILMHLGLQARAPPRAPARGQALAKRPEDSDSSPFRWPAEQGAGDRLRARVFRTDGCGAAPRANP